MNLVKLMLIAGLSAYSICAHGQSFYEAMPTRQMYTPLQRDDGQLFNLNPAVVVPAGNKVGGYIMRRERNSTMKLADDSTTTTKTELHEDSYGAGAVFDLGAATAAGLTAEKAFSSASVSSNSMAKAAVERMVVQTLTGRIVVELAQGLRIGLALRFMNERGDILGSTSANNDRDRIKYDGNLVGHGGGLQYAVDNFAIGAAYFPASRGKTEIISEERIMTEPGVALIDARFKSDKIYFALGIERATHRRDERAVSVTSETGNSTLTLDGISPDKNSFATQSLHGAVDWAIVNNIGLRLGVALRDHEWVFNNNAVPGDRSSPDKYTFTEWQAEVHFIEQIDILAGIHQDSYDTKLTTRSGRSMDGASYSAGGRVLFIAAGSKF